MKLFNLFIFIFSIAILSCKTSKNNTEEKNKDQNTEVVTDSISSTQTDNLKSRFKVSFTSIGSGIDSKMRAKYDQYIQKFEKDNGIKLVYEIVIAGKEGEKNYCFNLRELDQKKQETFISESIEILKTSTLVHFDENAVCH
jgi:hypothetical protein